MEVSGQFMPEEKRVVRTNSSYDKSYKQLRPFLIPQTKDDSHLHREIKGEGSFLS